MKYGFIAFFILVISPSILAEIPNSFTANTPAKAEEVNANFEYLDNKIDIIEKNSVKKKDVDTKIKSIENRIDKIPSLETCIDNNIDYPYIRDEQLVSLGTKLMFNNEEYIVLKKQITDPLTQEVFHLTLPAPIDKLYDFHYPRMEFISISDICGDTSIPNVKMPYRKNFGFWVTSEFNIQPSGSNTFVQGEELVIGSQLILIHMPTFGSKRPAGIVSNNSGNYYDMTYSVPDQPIDFSEEVDLLTNFLNYIIVEKIK